MLLLAKQLQLINKTARTTINQALELS